MKIEKLRKMIEESNKIVFFGGAGVSTESNIPDFRSSDGLYNTKLNRRFSAEEMVSHSFYLSHTAEFFDFYRDYMVHEEARPNKAHYALVRLEEQGKLMAIVTQNIDGLHQMAGSKNVYELHGGVGSNTCTGCSRNYSLNDFLSLSRPIPYCRDCGKIVKPDVVLYEEGLDEDVIRGAISAISKADMLIVGGTSLSVYPAAGFLNYFRGKYLVLINKSTTPLDSQASLVIKDSIGDVLDVTIL